MKLPRALQEVSGLTMAPNGNLLAIADEKGAVYEVSMTEPFVDRRTGFGDPPVKADFEGIAAKIATARAAIK